MRTRDFAVTAEIFLRPESNAEFIRYQVNVLRDHVDAILLTGNQIGQLHMSTMVAASILLDSGVDAVEQMTSRNRNGIALLSDLFGAGVLGVTSLLLARGEEEKGGAPPTDKTPIYVVGMPRSGSTLIQQILASHRMVEGAGELPYLVMMFTL